MYENRYFYTAVSHESFLGVADKKGCGLGCDPFAASGETEVFGCGSLYRYTVGRKSQVGGYIIYHPGYERQEFRRLGYYGYVNVYRSEPFFSGKLRGASKQHARVGTFVAWICIGEMITYISERAGTENGIAKSMESHIGIAMPQ